MDSVSLSGFVLVQLDLSTALLLYGSSVSLRLLGQSGFTLLVAVICCCDGTVLQYDSDSGINQVIFLFLLYSSIGCDCSLGLDGFISSELNTDSLVMETLEDFGLFGCCNPILHLTVYQTVPFLAHWSKSLWTVAVASVP